MRDILNKVNISSQRSVKCWISLLKDFLDFLDFQSALTCVFSVLNFRSLCEKREETLTNEAVKPDPKLLVSAFRVGGVVGRVAGIRLTRLIEA